jgi:hypothetical protein
LRKVREATLETASAQLFSAVNKTGVDEARNAVLALLRGARQVEARQ